MALAKEDIEIDLIATSETSVSFTLNPKDLEKAIKNLEELNNFTQLKISVEKDLSLIGVVGNQMRFTPGIAGRLFTALGKNNINIELISQSASELNISFVVKKEDLDKSIQMVHKEFLE
jgi:aspartate kinase